MQRAFPLQRQLALMSLSGMTACGLARPSPLSAAACRSHPPAAHTISFKLQFKITSEICVHCYMAMQAHELLEWAIQAAHSQEQAFTYSHTYSHIRLPSCRGRPTGVSQRTSFEVSSCQTRSRHLKELLMKTAIQKKSSPLHMMVE